MEAWGGRLVSAAPPSPTALCRGEEGVGRESVEKVCHRNSQGACSVLLGLMPQVPPYCCPLPLDLFLTSCLLHTLPCLSRASALTTLVLTVLP